MIYIFIIIIYMRLFFIILMTILVSIIICNCLTKPLEKRYLSSNIIEGLDNSTNNENNDNDNNDNNDNDNQEFQPYTSLQNSPNKGPQFLAIKNAANLQVLQRQLDGLGNIKQKMADLQSQLATNSKAIIKIGQQVQQAGYSVIGGQPTPGEPLPTITN